MTRHSEQVAQIVPVKHADVMHSCRSPAQGCGSRRADRSGRYGRMNASARARPNLVFGEATGLALLLLAIALQQRMLDRKSPEVESVSAPERQYLGLPLTRRSDSSASPRPSGRRRKAAI
jgi:hypothetical protein